MREHDIDTLSSVRRERRIFEYQYMDTYQRVFTVKILVRRLYVREMLRNENGISGKKRGRGEKKEERRTVERTKASSGERFLLIFSR